MGDLTTMPAAELDELFDVVICVGAHQVFSDNKVRPTQADKHMIVGRQDVPFRGKLCPNSANVRAIC